MLIFRDIDHFQPDSHKPLFLTLGNFDGLHLGHQVLLKKLTDEAKKRGGLASVFTFQEHPRQILNPKEAHPILLTDLEYKIFLLEQSKIDICFLISFTRRFSELSAEAFVEEILVKRLKVKKVLLGYNAHFGHDRKGDAALMRRLANPLGFEFEEIAPVKAKGDFVSSSRIRKLIEEGDLQEAKECLGRPFGILATVVPGAGRGKAIGFPTANLETKADILPPQGIYAVTTRPIETRHAGPWLEGVLNFGRRPTFEGKTAQPILEAHLLNFNGNLYGKIVEVHFYTRLRGEKKFEDAAALKQQIQQDIRQAKDYFLAKKNKENKN